MIRIEALRFRWPSGRSDVLDIPGLSIGSGERILLTGGSGSGKSTLLAALAGTVRADSGTVSVSGTDLSGLADSERDKFRADHIGVIFQMFNLVPYLDMIENVLLPCRFSAARRSRAQEQGTAKDEAVRLLATMGLNDTELLNKSVGELSVGQQQRVAAARALIGRPELILADEPTSALDPKSRRDFLDLLLESTKTAGSTLICASHDLGLGEHFDRTIDMSAINRAGDKAA